MRNLKEKYDAACAEINAGKVPVGFPLIDIKIALFPDRETPIYELDAKAFKAVGISLKEFQIMFAISYALETLGYHDNTPSIRSVLIERCKKCLDERPSALGQFLPIEYQERIQEKLWRNRIQLTLDI